MAIATTNVAFTGIQTEFGGSNPVALSEYYRGGTYVPTGTANGGFGLIATSGAISVGTFRGAAAFVGFTAVWGNAGQGQTVYDFASGSNVIYVYWTTTGASVSYVTIAGDVTHWGANNTAGLISFNDSSVAYPGTVRVTGSKVLSCYNVGGTLLNTITLTYYILPYGFLSSASISFSSATGLATLSYTTNGACNQLLPSEDDVAWQGAGSYYAVSGSPFTVPGANVGACTPITSTLTWPVTGIASRTFQIYCPGSAGAASSSGRANSVVMPAAAGLIVARFYKTAASGGNDQYYLYLSTADMLSPSGSFAYTISVVSGSFTFISSPTGNLTIGGTTAVFIVFSGSTSGTLKATITKSGYTTYVRTW